MSHTSDHDCNFTGSYSLTYVFLLLNLKLCCRYQHDSGQAVHNLEALWNPRREAWADEFAAWLEHTLVDHVGGDRNARLASVHKQPSTKMAHPRTEHFLPVTFAAAVAGDGAATKVYDNWFGSLSYGTYQFE